MARVELVCLVWGDKSFKKKFLGVQKLFLKVYFKIFWGHWSPCPPKPKGGSAPGYRTDRDSNLTVTINVSVETTIRTCDVYFFSLAPLVCLKGK
jgi:hypothetical protein